MRALAVAVAAVAVLPASASAAVSIDVLSSRADLVSGGDALVRLDGVPRRATPRVRLGARDVSQRFAWRANGRLEGLLTGVPTGTSTLTVRVAGRGGAQLALTGHPSGGPMISGPHRQPWRCQAGARDAQCNQAARYVLRARTARGWVRYDPRRPPRGVLRTTTSDGRRVPFVVRTETGYAARDQYRIATLFDPRDGWRPWAPQRGWNRRAVVLHGQSCGTDAGVAPAPDVLDPELLGRGYLVASTALGDLGHSCDPVLAAEAELMLRERIVERYGPVRAVLGSGCSGGSITQLVVAQAYPGLYDGVTVQCAFADLLTTVEHAGHGKVLGQLDLSFGEQALVGGSPLAKVDDGLFDLAFSAAIDRLPSFLRNVLGGGATFDNVGVQYGLKPLLEGALAPARFVEVNARAARVEADPVAVRHAYRSGLLAVGNTLAATPVLEGRGANELTAHVTYPTVALNARLDRFAGSHASHVVWQGPVPVVGREDFTDGMVFAMDRWTRAVQRDRRSVPRAVKVRERRPADVTDRCHYPGNRVVPGLSCPGLVRFYESPSQVAGESPRNDVLKCALRPLDRASYGGVRFTDEEWASLQATFPAGVCDWTQPGVGEGPVVPWLTYRDGPGGTPLGAPPRSRPLAG